MKKNFTYFKQHLKYTFEFLFGRLLYYIYKKNEINIKQILKQF